MDRRSFFAALAALPFVAAIRPASAASETVSVKLSINGSALCAERLEQMVEEINQASPGGSVRPVWADMIYDESGSLIGRA